MTSTTPSHRMGGSEDVSDVYERYGKPDLLSSIVGMLAGLGTLVFLGALIAAGAGGIDYQLNILTEEGTLDEASTIGLVVAAIASAVLVVATLAPGYVGGRLGEAYHTRVNAALIDAVRKED
jgi:hypothetical protein